MSGRLPPSSSARWLVNVARGPSFTNNRGRYRRYTRAGSFKQPFSRVVAKGRRFSTGARATTRAYKRNTLSLSSSGASTNVTSATQRRRTYQGNNNGRMGTRKENKAADESNNQAGDQHVEQLVQVSRPMTDVFKQSLDTMHHLVNDVNSTAQAMRTLVTAQRNQKAPPRASQDLGPGAYYEKQAFTGGNKGGPRSRDGMHSNAKQLVEVKVVFVQISEIDTVNQQFDAEVYIQARWREKQFSGLSEAKLASIEYYQCTDPQLKLLNLVGELDMERTNMVLRYEPDAISPVLVYMWHVRGVFRERMELQHFPFDVQELSIVLSSELPIEQVELVGDFFRASSVNTGALQTSQDWSNYKHVEITRDVSTQEMEGTSRHSVLVVAARVRRKLGFYFWNVVVIVFFIEGMTLVFLAVDPTGSTRLSLSITLFLTAVAFKLVVKNTLPSISYLTYLDVYVVFVMTYLFLWAAANALMCHLARYRERQRVLEYDEIAQSCLIGFLVLFHLLFLIYIQLTASTRRREMNKLDLKYQVAKVLRQGYGQGPQDASLNVNTGPTA